MTEKERQEILETARRWWENEANEYRQRLAEVDQLIEQHTENMAYWTTDGYELVDIAGMTLAINENPITLKEIRESVNDHLEFLDLNVQMYTASINGNTELEERLGRQIEERMFGQQLDPAEESIAAGG